MKRILLTLLMLLAPAMAHAQTATVTGHIQSPSGGASTNANVCFTLQNFKPNIPRIVATGIIVQQQNWCVPVASDGTINVQIDRNDLISPVGTFWRIDFLWNGVQQSSANYLINHTPFNLDTEVPLNQTVAAGPNQIVIACFPFLQASPATTWTITHNENDANVFVQTNDLTGRAIFADTTDTSNLNVTTITWVVAQAGRALVCHGGSINIATNQPNAIISNAIAPQTLDSQPTTFQGNVTVQGALTLTGAFSVASLSSACAPAAATGFLRLCTNDTLSWQNFANSAAIALSKDSSDRLTWGTGANGMVSGFYQGFGTNATSGLYRLPSQGAVSWHLAGAGTDISLSTNASDQFLFSAPILSPALITPTIGGGSALSTSNQTGTGSIVLATSPTVNSPTLTTPILNGAPTGSSLQGTDALLLTSSAISGTGKPLCLDAQNGATTLNCTIPVILTGTNSSVCTTGSSSLSTCDNTVNWSSSFADTAYFPSCMGFGPSDARAMVQGIISQATGSVVIRIVTEGSVAVTFTSIKCTGVHP